MSQVVESVAVAAPRGLVWRVAREIVTEYADPCVVEEPRELTWASPGFVEVDASAQHHVEMQWWLRLAPGWTGTDVEHGCTFSERPDLTEAVRARVIATLAAVKARAEAQ